MKALTVQQPWAWAILRGGKDVENRLTLWKYRGPLAIHAGARLSERGCRVIPSIIDAEGQPGVMDAYMKTELAYSAVLGLVDLVDVHGAEPGCCESWWAEPQDGTMRVTHLVLENPRSLPEPVLWKGALGLWNLPDEAVR